MICECQYCAWEGESDCPLTRLRARIESIENWVIEHTNADGDTVLGPAHEIERLLEDD